MRGQMSHHGAASSPSPATWYRRRCSWPAARSSRAAASVGPFRASPWSRVRRASPCTMITVCPAGSAVGRAKAPCDVEPHLGALHPPPASEGARALVDRSHDAPARCGRGLHLAPIDLRHHAQESAGFGRRVPRHAGGIIVDDRGQRGHAPSGRGHVPPEPPLPGGGREACVRPAESRRVPHALVGTVRAGDPPGQRRAVAHSHDDEPLSRLRHEENGVHDRPRLPGSRLPQPHPGWPRSPCRRAW